jgi:hypothetical protein
LRGFITAIAIPPGEGLLEVRGDLGQMLAATEQRTKTATAPRELAAPNQRSKNIMELLLQGFRDEARKEELRQIEQRRPELEAIIAAAADEPPPQALHPSMAGVYRQKVEGLAAALAHEDERRGSDKPRCDCRHRTSV